MSIRTQYNEFRQNLNKEIREMVKAIYVKTYGEKPNFAEGETYYLDMSDIPYKRDRMRICKISVDVYHSIGESDSCEKQRLEYINIDDEEKMDFETECNTIPSDKIKTDNLIIFT